MRRHRLIIFLSALVLLVSIWVFTGPKPSQQADLSFIFLGLTNNPGGSVYPRISVLSDGRGLHALFGVTNTSKDHYVKFGIDGFERYSGDRWNELSAVAFKAEIGAMWTPGHGSTYALSYPQGLPTNSVWKVRLWVLRERTGLPAAANRLFGRELFNPWGRQMVTSSAVKPLGLLEEEALEASTENVQPDGPANGSQPFGAEINRTSSAAGSRR